MNGFDMSQIPLFFLIFQGAVLGFFALIHFFMGMKRGVTKTLWFFIGQVALVFVLFMALGMIQTRDLVNEEMLRLYMQYASFGMMDVNQYLDQVIAAGAMPLLLAIIDLSLKIGMFVLFYTILKYIFQWVIFGIPWALFIKPIVKDMKKQRLLGGLVGIARGAFSGFILIFPVLILLNTIIDEGVEIESAEYQELSVAISEANQYNFVRYINDYVKVEEQGFADYMFDLAFRSKVNEGEVIIWRKELAWASEGAKAALPYIMSGEEFDASTITYDEILKYQGFFSKFAESQLIDSGLKPILKLGIILASDMEGFEYLTEEQVEDIIASIDGTDVSITEDINSLYLAVKDLLEIQDFAAWQSSMEDLSIIGSFDEDQQALFISALSRLSTLSMLNLGDPLLEVLLYDQNILDQLQFLETDAEKEALIESVLVKIRTYQGTFLSETLGELVGILDTTLFSFPGIDLDNDGTKDVDLSSFIANLQDITILLNTDDTYHVWFKDVLDQIASLSVIDVLLDPVIEFSVSQLTSTELEWTEEEFTLLKGIIENNISTQDDLKREMLWIADVYEKISALNIASRISDGDDPMYILDTLLINESGRVLFRDAMDTFLDGQSISSLTNQMSNVFIRKYLTEPIELTEPLYRALDIDAFSMMDEIDLVIDVLFGLYDEGLVLSEVMAPDADMFETILPVIINYVKNEEQRDLLLSSNILYSFIDSNLSSLEVFEIPSVVLETSGEYEGWIKKTELDALFTILGDLVEEMDNQGIDFMTLFEGSDALNAIFPVIKSYASDPVNRANLLNSDIIYKTLSDQIAAIDMLDIPDHAMVNDNMSSYNGWILRDELSKLLESIIILDLDLPTEGETFNLDNITGEDINNVIQVESVIVNRLISGFLIDANLFSIPDPAFVNALQEDLTQDELEALGQLLEDLGLNFGDLINGDSSSILNQITVEKLTGISYQNSYIMRGFITFGIETGIGTPHALALDTTYTDILSSQEIEEIFNILNALDEVPSLTVQELMDTLNPSNLSFNQINLIIQSGDSIVIRALFTENLLNISLISDLNIQDQAYHVHESVPQYDLISYQELGRLVDSIGHLSSDLDAPVLDSVSAMDTDTLSIQAMIDMLNEDSSIIRTLMSDTIIDFVTPARIMDDAYDMLSPGDLTKIELNRFFASIGVLDPTFNDGNPNNDQPVLDLVQTLSATVGDLSIGDMKLMQQEQSLIMQKFMSEGIVTAITLNDIREDAFLDISFEMVKNSEITRLLESLYILALSLNGNDANLANDEPISQIAGSLNPTALTPEVLRNLALESSIIVYRKITNAIVSTNISIPDSAFEVHAYTGDDLTQTEMTALADALDAFGFATLEVDLIDPGTTSLSDVKNVLLANSLIATRMISKAVIDANLDTVESRTGTEDSSMDVQVDELINLVDAFVAFGITDIDNAQSVDIPTLYLNAQAMNETEFNGYIDYVEPYDPLTEDVGLTIVKDFLISKLDNQIPDPMNFPNNYSVTNRQELNELVYP